MKDGWAYWRRDVSRWLLQIGSALAALTLAYLLWGGLRGHFTNPVDPYRVSMVANTLGYFLYCCGWAIALGLLGYFWDWRPIGVIMLVSSAVAWFVVPFLFAAVAGTNTGLVMQGAYAMRSLLTPLLLVGLGQAVWAFVDYWRYGPTLRWYARQNAQLVVQVRQPEKKRPRRRPWLTPLSPCWKMPVVERLMCEHCPVKHRNRPCWKLKGGCQCNPQIVDALVTGLSAREGLKVDSLATGTLLGWQKGQRPPCHRCAIYLLHQQVKYDWLAPISFFAPPVLLVLFWGQYQTLYSAAVAWLNRLWMQIAFTPPTSFDPLGLNNATMAVYVAVVLCVVVMVYALRWVEFALFRLYW
ncbi:hypothetical protein HRbin17_00604 [bacterium HR17]|uniref:Uncharacterized protein n=1 Tax=Candidatus Fervidibacter japonicus TaxID=2035412 RepID=A0A2H5XA94_9BACT|nr:hypothetical protein HRbin17_00604 [bacterium HR17]